MLSFFNSMLRSGAVQLQDFFQIGKIERFNLGPVPRLGEERPYRLELFERLTLELQRPQSLELVLLLDVTSACEDAL